MSQELVQFILAGLTVGTIYALVALGFTVTYNATGVVNFAQGEFVVLGGLLAVSLSSAGLPTIAAGAGAVLITGTVAAVVHTSTIARIPRATTFGVIMVTLGVAIVIRALALILWGSEARTLPAFSAGESIAVLGGTVAPQSAWIGGGTVVTMLAVYLFFTRTRWGDAMLATSDNREGASLVGVRTARVGLSAFVIGGMLAAIGGVLITPLTTMNYDLGLVFTIKGFTAAVLGGFGSPIGAVIGGIVLGLIEKIGAGYISTGYQDLISLGVLVLVLMVLPRGIVGSRALED